MTEKLEQKTELEQNVRKNEGVKYNLIKMEKDLPGYWMQYVSPEFEFTERVKYNELLRFPVHDGGVIIQKHIPEGQHYPDVRYYLIMIDKENGAVESYVLGKKDASKEMAENLKKFILKYIRLPDKVKLERVTKKGTAEFKYWTSKYDVFTMKIEMDEEMLKVLADCLTDPEDLAKIPEIRVGNRLIRSIEAKKSEIARFFGTQIVKNRKKPWLKQTTLPF